MIQFALAIGLRVGELTGLRWSDIDFKKKVLQYIMGHASISVTMDVYTHLTEFDRVQEKVNASQRKAG